MTPQLRAGHDTQVREALFGVQFRDALGGRVVADGLEVEIEDRWQPPAQNQRRRTLVANRSGVFVLHAFAGLRGDEGEALDPPPAPGRFRVTVRDRLARYVPTALSPALPGDGLFALAGGGSPLALPPHVPLFSAATRELPVGMASVRAELRVAGDDEAPVPWARLELWLGTTRLAEGLADEAGRVLLVFPLPRPPQPALRSSPASMQTRLEWTVTLRAHADPRLGADGVPDLEAVLEQPRVPLVQGASPFVPLAPLRLQGGRTLVAASPPSSYLYVAV